jgi:TolB-like protein
LLPSAILAHTERNALAKVQGMTQHAILLQGFQFAGLEVRPLEGEIRGPLGVSHVHPKAMEVFVCLAQRPGQVVQRNEVLDQVWGHHHGSDRALTRCISELRRAIGDREDAKRVIETIPKRGYRLVAELKPLKALAADPEASMDLSEKPSIAVLPFVNISSDPEQEYFSDGITEDVITDLSRFPDLFVIARNSSFTFKGKSVAIQEVSRQLGARYILEGSVRRSGSRIRVTAQLADSRKGLQIWAERYDRNLTDVFAMQDDITRQIVSVLPTKLVTPSSTTTRRRKPARNMEAYEYVLRGRELAWLHKRETGVEAKRLLGARRGPTLYAWPMNWPPRLSSWMTPTRKRTSYWASVTCGHGANTTPPSARHTVLKPSMRTILTPTCCLGMRCTMRAGQQNHWIRIARQCS